MTGRALAEHSPIIWLLTGHRAGDNAQVRALGGLLNRQLRREGRPAPQMLEKPLRWSAVRSLPNIALPPTLAVLDAASRAAISPPWPDLVIGVGRRAVPVARWIRQANPRVRIVWLGRPRAPLGWFDLLLSTPQYGLPADAPNVVMLDLPPAVPPQADEKVLEHWREQFAHLPRPWIGVLTGGARWPLLFDASDAHALGRAVQGLMQETGGSWIVSTSPRTGVRQSRALREVLQPPGWFHHFRAETAADPLKNPHRAILTLADCFVVTADSASLLAEAARTGKAMHMWPLRRSPFAPRWRADRGIARWLAVNGLLQPPRDMRAFADNLAAHGLANWLHAGGGVAGQGNPCRPAAPSGLRERALQQAVARIASWLAGD